MPYLRKLGFGHNDSHRQFFSNQARLLEEVGFSLEQIDALVGQDQSFLANSMDGVAEIVQRVTEFGFTLAQLHRFSFRPRNTRVNVDNVIALFEYLHKRLGLTKV